MGETRLGWRLSAGLGDSAGGVAAMLAACAMFVLGDSMLKLIGSSMPLGQMLVMRGLFAAPIIIAIAARAGVLDRMGSVVSNRQLQVRTALEMASTILFIAAIVRMPYADAIAIQQFVPLAVIASAAVFYGERVGWRRWLAAIVGLIGVMIIVRPGSGAFNWPALLALASVVAVTGRDLATRNIGAAFPSAAIAVMSICASGAAGLLLLPFETWRMPTLTETGLLAFAAVASIGGFYWVIEALRRGEVGVVMPFRYSLIPYGVFAGIVLFGEWPDLTSVAGIAIVLGAGLYALHRERVRKPART